MFALDYLQQLDPESYKYIAAALILAIAYFITKFLHFSLKRTAEKIEIKRNTRKTANWTINVVVYFIAIIIALNALGLDATTLIASAGIIALTVGFAAQQTIANIIAGFIIILEKPFKIGDKIKFVDIVGWVDDIRIRTTLVRTIDDNEIVIPNSNIVNATLVNVSHFQTITLISVTATLDFNMDIEKVMERVEKGLGKIDGCIINERKKPRLLLKPIVFIGKTYYEIKVVVWVDDSRNEERIATEITKLIAKVTTSAMKQ